MSGISGSSGNVKTKQFTLNLAQNAGTYDIFNATGDNILIKSITWRVVTAAVGLTSIVAATNDTTPVALLASILLVNLTAGLNLTPFNTPTFLASTKKGQYTIVGNGSAGSIIAIVEYYPGVGDLV